jgi:hypothetical protein
VCIAQVNERVEEQVETPTNGVTDERGRGEEEETEEEEK